MICDDGTGAAIMCRMTQQPLCGQVSLFSPCSLLILCLDVCSLNLCVSAVQVLFPCQSLGGRFIPLVRKIASIAVGPFHSGSASLLHRRS